MKNILLTMAVFAALSFGANAQQRVVLYEEFTGENCGPCAANNPALEALMGTNSTKAIHVTFMEPVPSSGYFYKSVQTLNDARMNYYNAYWVSLGYEFTPSGMLDGRMPDSSGTGSSFSCGNIGDLNQADIDNEYALPAPFTITATHYLSAAKDSVYGKVVIKAINAIGGNSLKLRVAFVKSMNFSHQPGSNGETHFENVARAMYPAPAGQGIATSWAAGGTNTYTYSGKVAHLDTFTNTTTLDSNFVVWIQNDSTASMFKVQQSALSKYVPLGVIPVSSVAASVNVYPNPAVEQATVSFDLENTSDVAVKVLDQLGRTVYAVPARNMAMGVQKIVVPTNALPAGIYSVLLDVDGTSVARKLSVIKY